MSLLLLAAILATVKIDGLTESSGLAASPRHTGVFWTMNDGSGPYLYAVDREGNARARVRIPGATNVDWEGLSTGPGGKLYIGDIGDNAAKRKFIAVYRIDEPALTSSTSSRAEQFKFTYPDGPHDAEALLIHPKTGDLYIVAKSKRRNAVYKASAPLSPKSTTVLRLIGEAKLPDFPLLTMFVGRVTGGDISPDGKRVILCDYVQGWEASVSGEAFDSVWKGPWRSVQLGSRAQGEGVAYRPDGKAILATSEGAEFPLLEVNVTSTRSVR